MASTILPTSEAQLQQVLLDAARAYGWLAYHARPGQTSKGRWLTPMQGDPGYPDLTLVHPLAGRILFAELKARYRTPSPEQQLWLDALAEAGAEVYTWRPADLDDALEVLRPSYHASTEGA